MLDASAQRVHQQDSRRRAPTKHPKGPAMRIGEEQEEFEILPAEEDQPVVVPEREPQQQPEDAPA
jgi:hypothetical protein